MGSVPPDKRNRTPICLRGWCPKYDHFVLRAQKVRDLFGLVCLICLETAAEKYDEPRRRRYSQDHIDRIRTPCGKHKPNLSAMNPLTEPGHSFCRSCIETAIKSGCHHVNCPTSDCDQPSCPTCRKELPDGTARLRNFRTVPCGDACEEGN
jgi:hypothetical protein